jgi:predicted nucleic acid-binding protein
MNNTFVILDSSALIAQINVNDLWHKKANETAEFIASTDRQVVLPYEVFAETLNRIGNNIGRQEAVLAGKALLAREATGDILLTQSNPGLLAASLELLKSVKETQNKRASFIDCLVMASANSYDTREIFGFDAVFVQNGYHLPGKAVEKQAA